MLVPSVNVNFYSPREDLVIALISDNKVLEIPPALSAESNGLVRLVPGSSNQLETVVSNLDKQSEHSGVLDLRLSNYNGILLTQNIQPIELSAGISQTYSLTLTAPITDGTYILELELNQGSYTSTVLQNFVYVWQPNILSTSPDWLGQTTSFTNSLSSPIYSDSTASSLWSFGDGITSTLNSPTHTYILPGDFTVILTATSLLGREVISDSVRVFSMPVASFESSSPNRLGQTTYFTNTSSTIPANDPSITFQWSFGDGIASTLNKSNSQFLRYW